MTLTTYSDTGAWVNGTTPVNATNMNAIRSFLIATGAMWDSNASWDGNGLLTLLGLKVNPTAVTVSGTTAGSASLYQWMQGTVKAFLLYFNGYRNASVTEQTISLPTPFTTGALWWAGASKSVRPYASSSALSNKVNVISTLSNGSGAGTATNGNATQGYSNGDLLAAFDAVGLGANEASTSTGFVVMIGI